MTGSLSETCYADVRERYESDQLLLSEYDDNDSATTIAVVRLPRDTNIDDYCDEWVPDLGMPEEVLHDFWELRAGYRTNSAVRYPHIKAYYDSGIPHRYKEYVRSSVEAQQALDGLVRRLREGENLTLVCFEESEECCHRHILVDMIERRIDNRLAATEAAGPIKE